MGNSRFDYSTYATSSSTRSLHSDGTRKAFTEYMNVSKGAEREFQVKNIKMRESCDSEMNPQSRPVMIAVDNTGSMGFIAGEMVNNQLGKLMNGLVSSKIITDPHLMFLSVGDVQSDREPLQASHYEADAEKIVDQLTRLYLEGNGGGNGWESYNLPWAFAAEKTRIDSWDKRKIKGYLFTIGDEPAPPALDQLQHARVFGASDWSVHNVLDAARERYEVFHVVVEQGSFPRSPARLTQVKNSWNPLLGNRVLLLNDYTKISEVILAAIAVNEGLEPEKAIERAGDAADAVRHALYGMQDYTGE